MHGPNHGCPKCIINYTFVAPIARLLASTVGEVSPLHGPALALASAADTFSVVFDHALETGVLVKSSKHDFEGCDEATALIGYVIEAGADPQNRRSLDAPLAEIKRIHTDILERISELVSNKKHDHGKTAAE